MTILYLLCFQPLIYQSSKTSYRFSVQISNGASAPATATVTVNVEDINNNAPVFTPATMSAQFSKSAPVGFTVATVSASDDDFGINANFR